MIGNLIHISVLFWIIMDPIGNVPLFVAVLKHLDHRKQSRIIIRETLIALVVMLVFFFFGAGFFSLLKVDANSMEITGGVILMLIALPMIFAYPPSSEETAAPKRDPLIVPLAVPAIAGPAILAAIVVYGGGIEQSRWIVLLAIVIAWIFTLPLLLLAPFLKKWMGDNGLVAIERLFGYILVLLSGQMILHGLLGAFG